MQTPRNKSKCLKTFISADDQLMLSNSEDYLKASAHKLNKLCIKIL